MRGNSREQARAAAIVCRTADAAEALGRWAVLTLSFIALARYGTELELRDLMPALAAYGAARFTAVLLEEVADWIAPGPTWREAAESLREVEEMLANSPSRVTAVNELHRHGGVTPVTGILRALAAHATSEKEASQEVEDFEGAEAQDRLERALKAAAREMRADMERARY
ncbi:MULTISPECIES: hypothetical protein [unclassified Streptomyces]|uniref:hypothetical protein n=1 Tax=unclassified Streptomyces TaxID=2593676 RepID=UPI00037E2830|nr:MULTISPECIES: hypothetical protein [unclassified Streptomyces]MYS36336.1 hypothetical protein [Streptomyces sp. SID4920]MYX63991.1 hypothetical protein [Streptomyces sp. SID8373]